MKRPGRTVWLAAGVAILANAAIALGPAVAQQPWRSFFLYAAAFLALYVYAFRTSAARSGSVRTTTLFILVTGVLLRLLFFPYPLSNDVNRYAWEGLVQQQGINPYITAPATMQEAFADDPIFAGINHKTVSAIYPPVSMLTFRAVSSLHYSLQAYKIFFIGCEILLLVLLVPLIRRWRVPTHWLALYAWNPLVLLYGAGEGHLDVLYLLFLGTAFLAFTYHRFAWAGFLLLGMAVMTKYLCVIFLPFLLTRENRKWMPFFFLPFLAVVPFLAPGMTQGLAAFSGEMAYNDVVPRLLRNLVNGPAYSLALLMVFTGGYGLIWLFHQQNRWAGMLYAYLWCILCLPSVHIWYLMPLALLMIRVPNRAIFLLMVMVGLGFHVMHHEWFHGEWREFGWIWCATYVPFFLLLIRDWKSVGLPWQPTYAPPQTVDILIPVFNEASRIIPHLRSLQAAIARADLPPAGIRLLAVDGGSTDDTRELLVGESVQCIEAPLGRGTQFAAGLDASDGDLVILLHADSLAHPAVLQTFLQVLREKPTVGWGVLGHGYDVPTSTMRIIRWLNRIRFHVFGIAFGDQGIFFRREVLAARGGMPAIPLMEDVELSIRLQGIARLSLGEPLDISARRWKQGSAAIRAIRIIGMVFGYLLGRRLGVNIKQLTKRMYASYYGATT